MLEAWLKVDSILHSFFQSFCLWEGAIDRDPNPHQTRKWEVLRWGAQPGKQWNITKIFYPVLNKAKKRLTIVFPPLKILFSSHDTISAAFDEAGSLHLLKGFPADFLLLHLLVLWSSGHYLSNVSLRNVITFFKLKLCYRALEKTHLQSHVRTVANFFHCSDCKY